MKKKCTLIVRGFVTQKVIFNGDFVSKIEVKKYFKEKYYNLCNAEYAIFTTDETPKYKCF